MRARGLLVALVLGGCALQAPPQREELRQQALPDYPIPEKYAGGAPVAGDVAGSWLSSFRDPALVEMVNEALVANPDLRVAAARVEQAIATTDEAAKPAPAAAESAA